MIKRESAVRAFAVVVLDVDPQDMFEMSAVRAFMSAMIDYSQSNLSAAFYRSA